MKKRKKNHDDWATPDYLLNELEKEFNFNFDPFPLLHDVSEWDALEIEWKERNYVNPPYSRGLKDRCIIKAIQEARKGKLCVCLIPVSTSTKLFHDHILPNITEPIRFLKGRVKFIGINLKGEYVNWHLTKFKKAPDGVKHVKGLGQHDSMICIFDYRAKD